MLLADAIGCWGLVLGATSANPRAAGMDLQGCLQHPWALHTWEGGTHSHSLQGLQSPPLLGGCVEHVSFFPALFFPVIVRIEPKATALSHILSPILF